MLSPELRDLIHLVLPHFGLESEGEDAVTGKDRHKTYAEARGVSMWLVRQRTGMSFPEIGRAFCRDHTTVMHYVRRLDARLAAGATDHVTSVARAVLVAARSAVSHVGSSPESGARELSLSPMPLVKIELDETFSPFNLAAGGE